METEKGILQKYNFLYPQMPMVKLRGKLQSISGGKGPQICPFLKICARAKQGKSCLGHVVTEVCFLKWQEMERKKEKQPGNSFKMRTSTENFRVVIVILLVLNANTKTSSN